MFLIATVVSVSMININSISTMAMTQDEYVEAIRQYCEENGINTEDLKTTGGTANGKGGTELTEKLEEINKDNETPKPQPTQAPEPTKEVKEPITEVVETVVEPTKEDETTEEIKTAEEETSTEEITTTEEPTTIEEPTTTEETTTEELEDPTQKMNIAVIVIILVVVVIGLAVSGIRHKKNDKH